MATKRDLKQEYYCIMVKRDYEDIWRVIGKYETYEAADAAMQEKRAYTGSFNYDNAELRVVSRAEAKKIFGSQWEYHPIGEKPAPTGKAKRTGTSKVKAKVGSKHDDDE